MVPPTKPYADPAWLRCLVSRTKLYPTSDTPTSPMRNTSGMALPTVAINPWPLPDIARVGPTRATDIASATQNGRRRWGSWPVPSVGLADDVLVLIDVSFWYWVNSSTPGAMPAWFRPAVGRRRW